MFRMQNQGPPSYIIYIEKVILEYITLFTVDHLSIYVSIYLWE